LIKSCHSKDYPSTIKWGMSIHFKVLILKIIQFITKREKYIKIDR
jgi:hypothetical protein